MKRQRSGEDVLRSNRYVADVEQRIIRQRQLVAELQRKGRSTVAVKAELQRLEHSLMMLRNHREILQGLIQPDSALQRRGLDEGSAH